MFHTILDVQITWNYPHHHRLDMMLVYNPQARKRDRKDSNYFWEENNFLIIEISHKILPFLINNFCRKKITKILTYKDVCRVVSNCWLHSILVTQHRYVMKLCAMEQHAQWKLIREERVNVWVSKKRKNCKWAELRGKKFCREIANVRKLIVNMKYFPRERNLSFSIVRRTFNFLI